MNTTADSSIKVMAAQKAMARNTVKSIICFL